MVIKNIKHAIIGCGRIAPSHVNACIYNGVLVDTCFDIDKSKAIVFAKKNKIKRVANSFEEILNDDSITSVSICTDHLSHAELTIKALKSGKNVIVEKPMALSIKMAKKMIETAKNNHKVLAIISQHRYNKMIQEIRKIVKEGILGKVTLINATLNCQKDIDYYTESNWKGTLEKEGGSTLINQAIHTLDLILWINGLPTEVKSFGSNIKFKNIIKTEDTFAAIMKFKNESIAVLSSTNTSVNVWDSKIEIIGIKGSIAFSTGFPPKILFLIHKNSKTTKYLRDLFDKNSEKIKKPLSQSYYGTTHRQQMSDFFDVISKKSNNLFMDPIEALKTLSVVLKLYQHD